MKSRVYRLKALREVIKICGMRREDFQASLEKIQTYLREWAGITEFYTLTMRGIV